MSKRKTSSRTNAASSSPRSGSTADRVAAMSDADLAAEYARMLQSVRNSEEKLAALPRPFPPEMSGYRNPSFQLYLDRKYLNGLADEVIAREKAR